jgi:long-chain acyl-CoA synthetase
VTEVFITGVTGFLGRQVALRLLRRADITKLHCLVRAASVEEGETRLRKSLGRIVAAEELESLCRGLVALPGDLTAPDLGLAEEALRAVRRTCRMFLHCAADVRFDQPLDDARERNLKGTQRVAKLALSADQVDRFDWVGTAFVAGLRRDRVLESDFLHEAGWKNSYEQSKYEAERWLRTEATDLPLTVFRPSIIVGESKTGRTSSYGVLYWPVQIYARGWWRTVIGRADTPIDIVPVDYVADAIAALTGPGQPTGRTYHLAAGPEGSLSVGAIADLCRSYFSGPKARYIDAEFFMRWLRPILHLFLWGKRGRVLKQGGRFFVPYFSGNPIFDVSQTRTALRPFGLEPPQVVNYMTTLLDYCVSTDFGRREAEPPSEDIAGI